MRKIYKIPRREHGKAAAIACTIAALALMGLLTHSRTSTTVAVAAEPPAAAAVPSATVYFPSQYELNAGAPEPLPAQF